MLEYLILHARWFYYFSSTVAQYCTHAIKIDGQLQHKCRAMRQSFYDHKSVEHCVKLVFVRWLSDGES